MVSAPQLPTPGWPLRERRETPPRQCFFCLFLFLFLFFFLFVCFLYFFFYFIFFFFFFWGGGAVRGVWGYEWGFSGEGSLGRGWVEGGVWGCGDFWGEVMDRFGRGEELGVGVFSGGEVLGSGFWCRSFGVGLWVGLGVEVGCGLGVVHPGFFSLLLKLLSCSPLFFLPSASTFLWKTEGILAATVFILLPFYGVLSIYPFYF